MMGRYKKRDISLQYRDEDPIVVNYIAFKTVGPDGTWKFYDSEYLRALYNKSFILPA